MVSPMLLLTLLAVFAALAFICVKRIPEGEVYTLRRLGGQARTLSTGIHLIVPLLERIVHRISLTGRTLALNESLVVDGCAYALPLRGTVYWQVLDAARADSVIERADDLIRTRAVNAVRDVPAPDREVAEARNVRLKEALNGSLRERGVLITRVQLSLG